MKHLEWLLCSILLAATAAIAAPALAGSAEGEIVAVDARTVSVRDVDGQTLRFEFDPQIDIACPNEPRVSVLDLRRGQTVRVTYDGPRTGDPHPTALRILLHGDAEIDHQERYERVVGQRLEH